jgi:hypothetical protein
MFFGGNSLTTRRARVVSYALGAYKIFYRKYCRRNFKKSSFDWKLKKLLPFLIVESDWRATSPPFTPTFSPNTSNENCEIVILFKIVESSEN